MILLVYWLLKRKIPCRNNCHNDCWNDLKGRKTFYTNFKDVSKPYLPLNKYIKDNKNALYPITNASSQNKIDDFTVLLKPVYQKVPVPV